MIRKVIVFLMIALLAASPAMAQKHKRVKKVSKSKVELRKSNNECERWADSVMAKMTLEEMVGQLMMIRVPINMSAKGENEFFKKVKENKVGGVCFFAGTATKQIELTQRLQKESKIPLMVAIDAENGLGMRLKDCYSFPKQMLMGAMPKEYDQLIMKMGEEIGRQCKAIGVHVNFAPDVDLNSNPKNPVIGARSFGENKERVAHKGIAYMKGLQKVKVMAVAKHFTGHGDTETDSHLDLPLIKHSKDYVDSIDLYPFKAMIKAGVQGVMTAHLQVDCYDKRPNRPVSLSEILVNRLLCKELGFNGLVFTDGLDMKGVTKYYKDGDGELEAMKAGNDVLLLPPDVEKSVAAICVAARKNNEIKKLVEEHCRKILAAKYNNGVCKRDYSKLRTPTEAERQRCDSITYEMALHAVTLLKNEGNLLPLADNAVIDTNQIMVLYCSPYAMLKKLDAVNKAKVVVMAYQDLPMVRRAVDSLLHGKSQFVGTLPVTADRFREGFGLQVNLSTPYDKVKAAGMDVACFKKIDSIAEWGITQKAYPGCQILVAKDGEVVYNRSYGRQTYDLSSPLVDSNTVYDIASLTKTTATTLAVMRLVDQGKIQLDDKLSRYLPYLKHSNKKNITVREALSHIARLKSYDSYWKEAAGEDDPYMSVLNQIAKSKLNKDKKYEYSDLGFILMGDMVKQVSGQPLDQYVAQNFYTPMGLHSTTFCPLDHGVNIARIAPTEDDKTFRHELLRGKVHDQNAYVMGGVSGHAGVFSNASDLGKIYQMLLDGGEYRGTRYISKETVDLFNTRHYAELGNRRALGFDKPMFSPTKAGQTAVEASQKSFGHTGFTGTMVWVDPEYGLIYVFLSNRVYPDASTNKLAKLNIRTDIQSLIYKSIKKR